MIAKSLFRCAGAFALLSSTQLVAAQTSNCLTEPEVRGLVAYALPSVAEAVVEKCSARLPGSSYLNTRGPRLVTDLRSGQSAAWPAARNAMAKLGGDNEKSAQAFLSLPESVVGPMMEGMVASKFTNDIKPENCKDIDRVLGTMAPMPAANVVDLFTAVVMIAGRNDKQMKTCPA